MHLDDLAVKSAWGEWAHGPATISPKDMLGPLPAPAIVDDEELAGEFLDLTYLHDAPVAVAAVH